MYTCAIQISEYCYGTNIGYRGVCSKCYGKLVELGEICQGDKFEDFPTWLQEMIREQDKEDHARLRHPVKEFEDEENNDSGTRINLGLGCFKLRKMNTSTDFGG